jgi:hypothetical protein
MLPSCRATELLRRAFIHSMPTCRDETRSKANRSKEATKQRSKQQDECMLRMSGYEWL